MIFIIFCFDLVFLFLFHISIGIIFLKRVKKWYSLIIYTYIYIYILYITSIIIQHQIFQGKTRKNIQVYLLQCSAILFKVNRERFYISVYMSLHVISISHSVEVLAAFLVIYDNFWKNVQFKHWGVSTLVATSVQNPKVPIMIAL